MDKHVNLPQIGMVMKNPSLLKEGEYPLAVNSVIQSVNGNFALINNENSNILATNFKDGYKVIGFEYSPSLSTTFFFLTNPTTGDSEIGFIYDTYTPDKPDAESECSDCQYITVESPPLETITQNELNTYFTFVNAKCLNFDIDHPITSWIKIDDCNIRIYFNDFKNPPRYIDYKDFQKVNLSNCPLIETCDLDCDKIKVFPETCYPIVEAVDVVPGGQNTAGVYQFAIAYSDVRSNQITNYFYVTNPIPLYNLPIINNTRTDYPIAKSIKLRISNLNTDFKYFNLVVIKTINNVSSVYLINTFNIRTNNFEYIYTGVDKNLKSDLTLDDILGKKPIYNKAKITTESTGYLFLTNLEEDRVLNLQPVVNDIPLYWQTVEMDEGSYANPVIAQNNVGYLGDEVYPFGISFTKTNGTSTNIFLFVGREKEVSDGVIINNKDVIKNSSCDPEIRNETWQVYNTAEVLGDAICINDIEPDSIIETIVDNIDCYSEDILYLNNSYYLYPPNSITYPPTNYQQVNDLNIWINNPSNLILNPDTNPTSQDLIGLCNCEDFLSQFPSGAIVIPSPPIILDPNDPNTALEIITEPFIFTVNNYTTVSPITANDLVPKPSAKPSGAPDPCRNYTDAEDDDEKGFQAWIDAKENGTYTGAELLTQSSTDQCNLDTWGSFIGNNGNPTESWYQFYLTNQDGVASVLLSTEMYNNCNGNGLNNADIEVYATDNLGNPSILLTPLQKTFVPNGIYVLLTGLQQGTLYYIKVAGQYPDPTGLVRACCKERTFRVCVTSPKPSSSTVYDIPGSTKIRKTCNIQYQGVLQNSCSPAPDKYGKFAYWESQETYPCNEEVWGSLAGKPIRHFKFPDNQKVKFFDTSGFLADKLSTKSNKIYPKGIRLDVNDLKKSLIKAVDLGLITQEEVSKICGYRIYRGNRRGNQSIIAKGLLYDVWEYKDNIYNTGNKVLFPNFPFNDNGVTNNGYNIFIKNKKINKIQQALDFDFLRHPYTGVYHNNKYTFDAPNLSFNNPGLGVELKLEGELYGNSVGSYVELRNNTKYQYIGPGIISAAIGFASVEASFEALNTMVNATLTMDLTVFGTGSSIPLGLILALVGENILSPIRMYSHYSEWYEIIKKFAPYRNYATYYTGVGKYTNNKNIIEEGNRRRNILNSQYIKPGILNVKTSKGNVRFNNFKKDSSVFFELDVDSYFNPTSIEDKSRRQLPACITENQNIAEICSYYGSMKNTLLSQYGQVENIEWIDTGYNGKIIWNVEQNTLCDTIFGGDTYINRFTKKRKTPLFMEDRVIPTEASQVSPVNQDIQLSLLPNIGFPRYWMDYPTSLDYTGATQALFGDVAVQSSSKMDYNFVCKDSSGKAWKDAGLAAAILGSFSAASFGVISLPIAVGVISGAVQNDLGNDLYLNGKYVHSFYGITSFLCESDYNLDYRHGENIKEKNFYPNVGDINEWTQEFFIPMYEDNYYLYNNDYSKQNTLNPNFILNNDYNQEKEQCKSQHPNRIIYSLQDNDQNDKYDGNLVFLANNTYEFPKSGGKVLIVKGIENEQVLVIQENKASVFNSYITLETNVATSTVGNNSLFNRQSPSQFIETDLGFGGSQTNAIVSTEFGHFWVDNKRGQVLVKNEGINNIVKPEEDWWFKENLPFQILKDFPDFDITNNFKYLGMTITYDARFKRILFTKRDVQLKPEFKGRVKYNGDFFNFEGINFGITNSNYFCNKSWTISYSPVFKSFSSFHSYTPNYYIGNNSYFSSGINFPLHINTKEGLWHHNLTNKSYQVFYGKLEPFIFEYALPSKFQNNVLESVEYNAEFYRFKDNLSFYQIQDKTYNKAIIYNQNQISGLLELVVKEKNNRNQYLKYPFQTTNSRQILVENIENTWNFNNFYNVAQQNGQPILMFNCNNIAYKTLNDRAVKYNTQFLKDLLRSDYHVIRLINDKYSNYHILQRHIITQTENSIK